MKMAKAALVHDDYLVSPLVTSLCTDKRHSTWKLHAALCSIHFRYWFAKSKVDVFVHEFCRQDCPEVAARVQLHARSQYQNSLLSVAQATER